jgi:hypothetical protein
MIRLAQRWNNLLAGLGNRAHNLAPLARGPQQFPHAGLHEAELRQLLDQYASHERR